MKKNVVVFLQSRERDATMYTCTTDARGGEGTRVKDIYG